MLQPSLGISNLTLTTVVTLPAIAAPRRLPERHNQKRQRRIPIDHIDPAINVGRRPAHQLVNDERIAEIEFDEILDILVADAGRWAI